MMTKKIRIEKREFNTTVGKDYITRVLTFYYDSNDDVKFLVEREISNVYFKDGCFMRQVSISLYNASSGKTTVKENVEFTNR